ncbi:MAG: hypothetical protein ACO1O1_02855 [Adhaeribacter sp.]
MRGKANFFIYLPLNTATCLKSAILTFPMLFSLLPSLPSSNPFMNKPFLTLLVLFLVSSTAQSQHMGAVNAVHNQMFMQQMQFNMLHRLGTLPRTGASASLINRKYNYLVVMNSGATVEVLSKMEFDEKGKAYLVLTDNSKKKGDSLRTHKIQPAMTRSISPYFGPQEKPVMAMAADSCWLFKAVSGAVNGYTFLPPVADLHIGYFSMLQKGEGEMLPLNEANMRKLFADDPQVLTMLGEKRYYEALLQYNKNSRKKARKDKSQALSER